MSHLNLSSPAVEQFSQNLITAIKPVQERLQHHPLYKAVKDARGLRIFMTNHVFAVWDFMSLLKRLQIDLTCTTLPWVPGRDPVAARFVNEVVLGEECDVVSSGTPPISHYDLYINAMKEVGSDTKPIETILARLKTNGGKWPEALEYTRSVYEHSSKCNGTSSETHMPKNTFDFVGKTFEVCDNKAVHQVAGYFLYGREDPIPEMFQSLLGTLEHSGVPCSGLLVYLKRHIEVDSEEHGPLVAKLMKMLCSNDSKKWEEATKSAVEAIEARIMLWDGILHEIDSK